jgi:outer membrane protein OmpU
MNIKKGEIMDNLKKVGITALAGSLAAFSANAAEMSVSGATLATYTSEDSTETTGNPLGLKTNLVFSASGEVNGYTVSYFQVSADQFAGMSSAGLAIDMGDIGSFGIDQTTTSGIASIDDKTPTAAEEVWDGLGSASTVAAGVGARVGATAGGTSFVYKNSVAGMGLNVAVRPGSAGTSVRWFIFR